MSLIIILAVVVGTIASVAAAYNETLAKELTLYSSAAYSDTPSVCTLAKYGTVAATFKSALGSHDVFGYTLYDDSSQKIVVAFRGSANFGQIIDQIFASSPVKYPYTSAAPDLKVLTYFIVAYDLLRARVSTSLKDLLVKKPYQVYITGHSLGGAIATLAAFDFVSTGLLPESRLAAIYTMGQPRVGNAKFAKAFMQMFGSKAARVNHDRDMVSHIPPCPTKFDITRLAYVCDADAPESDVLKSWYHFATEIWYREIMPSATTNAPGAFKVCTGTPVGEDQGCSNGLAYTTSIDNHRNYFSMSVGGACTSSQLHIDPKEDALLEQLMYNLQKPDVDREAYLKRVYKETGYVPVGQIVVPTPAETRPAQFRLAVESKHFVQ